MSQVFESFEDNYGNGNNENRNSDNYGRILNGRNASKRGKVLPDKLEKYLNNEKERELESLYEENRQLLLEISKLKKSNQMLIKDVTKKNEIIDNLDSNLSEVETKLENIKKKNINMYNEILNRERIGSDVRNKLDTNEDSNEYCMKASKVSKYNTVDITKSDLNLKNSKTDSCNGNSRPKSCNNIDSARNNVDMVNSKWFQDMILKTINESEAYDSLKCEVERLQKEIHSMQNDINRSSSSNLPGNVDMSNINTVFDSRISINNTSSSVNTNSLAEELKEINSSNTVDNNKGKGNVEIEETIPPRSVHILMGKTFSKFGSTIDEKINQYKNHGADVNLNEGKKAVCSLRSGDKFRNEAKHSGNEMMKNADYYSFENTAFNKYVFSNNQNENNRVSRVNLDSFNLLNGSSGMQQQIFDTNNHLKHARFHNQSTMVTGSTPMFCKRNGINSLLVSDNCHPHGNQYRYLNNNYAFTGGFNCNRTLPFSEHFPQGSSKFSNYSNLQNNSLEQRNDYFLNSNGYNMCNSNSIVGNVYLPFRIKVTQKFRRTRNISVPPRHFFDGGMDSNIADYYDTGMTNCDSNNNMIQDDIPQGYIRFKTSIASPIGHSTEYLSPDPSSPYSFTSLNGICPCDKATSYCNMKENSGIQSNSNQKPRYVSLNNQPNGSVRLLKFK